MKWLIVSTNDRPHLPGTDHPHGAGWNIGDQFARLGTEQLIREVDPEATFDLLNMDSHESIVTPREFDRCVLAGRPMFWAECEKHPLWTHVLNGWPAQGAKQPLALGVGGCYEYFAGYEKAYEQSLSAAQSLCHAITLRDVKYANMNTASAISSICPSAWLLMDRPEKPKRKLVNVMVGGGHYPHMNFREMAIWGALFPVVLGVLRELGFDFVAHTAQERDLALAHGYEPERIVYGEAIETYLDAYASASHYIGNRMHGAVVLAGRMARAIGVGYDSRIEMLQTAGVWPKLPSAISMGYIEESGAKPAHDNPHSAQIAFIREERARMRAIVEDFAK